MKIEVIATTNGLKNIQEIMEFCRPCGRVCYSEKDFSEVLREPYRPEFIEGLIHRGHHSVFEHFNVTFYATDLPKITAMVLNNERQMASSEKSARYTQMKVEDKLQQEKYDKWMGLLTPLIYKEYPQMKDPKKRDEAIKKLAQENARYMTSVFTPTKLVHTVNLRQINFLMSQFDAFYQDNYNGSNGLKSQLASSLKEFSDKMSQFRDPELTNQTDRHLSLFTDNAVEEHFGSSYSTSYHLSFAGLAQAHRHRTIEYSIVNSSLDTSLFFIPKIVSLNNLSETWLEDLEQIASNDYPQGQLVKVNEQGTFDNFNSKRILRLCGHAQHEIMNSTLETAIRYASDYPQAEKFLTPYCKQDKVCKEPCVWGPLNALERII